MAAATVDPVYLSTYLDVPQATVTSVLDSPTVELVNSVLLAVTLKARQHEELQADKLRVDIELENAVRGADSRAQGLKATADKALKDVEELRQQLKNEGILHKSLLRNERRSLTTVPQKIRAPHWRLSYRR